MNLIEEAFYYFVNMPIGRGSFLERVSNITLEQATAEIPSTGIRKMFTDCKPRIHLHPRTQDKACLNATSKNASSKSASLDRIDLKSASSTNAALHSGIKRVTSKRSTLESTNLKSAPQKCADVSRSVTSKSGTLESTTLKSSTLQSPTLEGKTCDNTIFDIFRYVKPRSRKSIQNKSSIWDSGSISPLSGRKYWLNSNDNNYIDAFNTNEFTPLHVSCTGKFANHNNDNFINNIVMYS